jgi:hypothetical protein
MREQGESKAGQMNAMKVDRAGRARDITKGS